MSLSALDAYVDYLQSHAIEKSTLRGYLTGARDYVAFCIAHHLPLNPTPQTLARYLAFTSRRIASGPKYLTGARHFLQHHFPDFELHRRSPYVQAVIRGARKVRADPIRRKLPLRLYHLTLFRDLASASQRYDDLLFATILACAFFACHRIGELVVPNTTALRDWRKIIKRSSLSFDDITASYTLPYHKGDPFYHGTRITLLPHDTISPVTLLHQYLTRRDRLHGARLALFIREDGSFPSRSWFESRFFTVLSREYGGHSARAGGATYYANLGVTSEVIQALGRWSSSTWRDYIRDNPAVRVALQCPALLPARALPSITSAVPLTHSSIPDSGSRSQ